MNNNFFEGWKKVTMYRVRVFETGRLLTVAYTSLEEAKEEAFKVKGMVEEFTRMLPN